MSEQSSNHPFKDDISFKDIIDFLLESWKAIAICVVVGGGVATGYTFISPIKYQAIASIQVTKVAGSDIEAPNTLLEKLKIPTYYSTVSYSACNLINGAESGEIIAKNLKPTLSKVAPIISFAFIESSPEAAEKCLEGILNDIRLNQNLLATPIIELKKEQLKILRKKLDGAERVRKIFPYKDASFDSSDSKISSSTLMLATSVFTANEILNLRNQINDLESSLAGPQTKELSLVAPIYASKQKVSPKRAQIFMGGLMAGLFLGMLFIIGKRSWLAIKVSNQKLKVQSS